MIRVGKITSDDYDEFHDALVAGTKLGDKDIPISKRVEYRKADIQKQEEKMKQLQQEAKKK